MMQAPPGPQRPSQRRPPTEPGPPPNAVTNVALTSGSQTRTSSGSGRPQVPKPANPDKQISQIEKSVTHLLVATKQLLETLTQWSRKQAQEEEVSDVYVRLGYEFNLACRAFNSIGVETSDLGPVPDLLRSILEDTLSQAASPQALDNYLPRIRDIIINLLHGLKRKQSKLRNRSAKEGSQPKSSGPARQASGTSLGSNETGLTHMLEDVASQPPSNRAESRQDSVRSSDEQSYINPNSSLTASGEPGSNSIKRQSMRREMGRPAAQSDSSSSMSSTTAQNIPVLPPYADPDQVPNTMDQTSSQPPLPPPKQADALAALQRGGDLERRASRRFSAYQIQKHLGASPNGIPVIPPAQNSPIPNRGREVRESMSAVRSRTSYQHARTKSNNRLAEPSPTRSGTFKSPQRISEESEDLPLLQTLQDVPRIQPTNEPALDDSPTAKTPEEFHRPMGAQFISANTHAPLLGATVNGPLSPVPTEVVPSPIEEARPPPPQHQLLSRAATKTSTSPTVEPVSRSNVTPPQSQIIDLDSSPPQGKELTLFLQYKTKVKKFVLVEGYSELTIARLQLAFIEKFAWNTHNNGVDLPEIYIQDPVSGVRHELEDLSDVKDRSVLVLNVEVLDEVKKHFDEGIGGLRQTLEGVRSLLDGQGSLMQRFSDRQLETSKDLARMSATPSRPALSRASSAIPGASGPANSAVSVDEVRTLRRDIAVLRQTYSNMSSDFAAAMSDIKTKATKVKSVAADAIVPSYAGDAGRAHINGGKKTLTSDSEALVNQVDDLQDRVEDLRKDVVTRGVRPMARQLEEMSKDISVAAKDLAKMRDFIKREKPIWTKIWEHELNLVCTERDELTTQEELLGDLQTDLKDLNSVFTLVEEATKAQNLQNGSQAGLRSTSRSLPFETDVDPLKAKDGVLGEVRALQPNHENRLEAIERAEKLRQKELESRKGGEFQREVEKFVEEGKLKKTGGADEVERLRKLKDERARKENWDRAQTRQAEMEARAAEEAAAAAAERNGNGHGRNDSQDHSQDGEAAFEDANEGTGTPSPPIFTTDNSESTKSFDGPPQLPEIGQQNKAGDTETPKTSSWLPSFFSSPTLS